MSPKDTNVQLKIVSTELVWAYYMANTHYYIIPFLVLWIWVGYRLLILRLELKRPVGKFENKYASLYYVARAAIAISHKPGGLKQTSKKSFFMVLETKSLKFRCQQDCAASEVLGKKLFYASLLVSGGSRVPWLVASSFQFLPASPHGRLPSLSLSLSVSMCKFPSYKNTSHREFPSGPVVKMLSFLWMGSRFDLRFRMLCSAAKRNKIIF